MLGGHFYHKSMRKYTILITDLFSNLYVTRGTGFHRVPASVGSKEIFYAALNHPEYNDTDVAKVSTILPRIGINMVALSYDGERHTNTANRETRTQINNTRPSLNSQFNAVPFDFEFDISIYTRHQDDMYQIVEQILPYFTPSFNTVIKELDENEITIDQRDIPIILESVSPEEDLEGSAGDMRRIEWTLSTRLKGWLYPPTNTAFGEIRTIYLDFNGEEQVIIKAERQPISNTSTQMWTTRKRTPDIFYVSSWQTRNIIDNTLIVGWNTVLKPITNTLDTNWERSGKVWNFMDTDWDTRSFISNTTDAKWGVINSVQSNLDVSWNTNI